jgi:hypothetical protein
MRHLAAIALLACACTSKISGDLTVDGTPFTVKECRSGRAFGFDGIQLVDTGGRTLRMLPNADGTTRVAIFAEGAARGDTLGGCGILTMQAQSSTINNIVNMKGSASLSCAAIGHSIQGKITFENCH